MTIEHFKRLDEMEQAEAVWRGVQVNQRDDAVHSLLLYKIDDFYVEVYYHKEYDVIRKFEAIREDQLIFYADINN